MLKRPWETVRRTLRAVRWLNLIVAAVNAQVAIDNTSRCRCD